jgi:hypothetical protein
MCPTVEFDPFSNTSLEDLPYQEIHDTIETAWDKFQDWTEDNAIDFVYNELQRVGCVLATMVCGMPDVVSNASNTLFTTYVEVGGFVILLAFKK